MNYPPFLLRASGDFSLLPAWVKWKLGHEILWMFRRIFALRCVCRGSSWRQWLLSETWACSPQPGLRREGSLVQGSHAEPGTVRASQRRCLEITGTRGERSWPAAQPPWTATNLGLILSASVKDKNIMGHMARWIIDVHTFRGVSLGVWLERGDDRSPRDSNSDFPSSFSLPLY